MVKHVVMWRFQDHAEGRSKEENIAIVKDALESLPGKILKIQEYEVGINFVNSDAAFDMVLISGFQSVADLDAYRVHPDHVAVADLVKKVVSDRAVVDYEL